MTETTIDQPLRKTEKELEIIIDSRELRSKVAQGLYEAGIKLTPKTLPVGDFIISDRVCVERKTDSDFVGSIIDGRIFTQASELVNNFDSPIIIVEGNCLNNSRIHPNAVRGALASLAIDFRIPVLSTCDLNETVLLLVALARREQEEKKRYLIMKGDKNPILDRDLQKHIVSSLPGVGASLCENLLKHFKSVKSIFNASEDELAEVPKIGEKKSKQIKKNIEKEYK